MKVAILGAGAMAGALGIHFHRAGASVAICATKFDAHILEAMRKDRKHPTLGHWIPEAVDVYDHRHWHRGFRRADIAVLAVPSVGVLSTVTVALEHLSRNAIWAVATKGWVAGSGRPMSEFLAEVSPGHPVVMLVGPSLAAEIAAGTPTALVCASKDAAAAKTVAEAISNSTLRGFVSDDIVGVEVGAAVKNVLAIAIGMCDGLEEVKGRSMINTKGALFSRGLLEMGRLAVALGGRQETVLGLSGAGDLYLTVAGGRNGRFGRLVGTGLDPIRAFEQMGTTVEGFDNTREAVLLAKRHAMRLPVVEMTHSVLFGGADPEQAILDLVLSPLEPDA
ncbi:MAG TPA: NAD(P)H-dependent glycerol-3-phosphate dehydrogenase [Actinomycetota bacterium]|nr:NAD(P)H-dependent glycerol-3-phosphate dehydrogenase [Actinomycetota bacterium]